MDKLMMTSTPLSISIYTAILKLQDAYCEHGILITQNSRFINMTFRVEWLVPSINDNNELKLEDDLEHDISIAIDDIESITVCDNYETGEKVTSIIIKFSDTDNFVIDIINIGTSYEE